MFTFCWRSENQIGPRTQELRTRVMNGSAQVTKSGETKNLRKSELASKVVNPFTRVLAPPFTGRRGTFTFRDYPRIKGIFLM
jgi:hypothetical protein